MHRPRVLQGLAKPVDCSAFGTRCTPETPLGAPMVSSEGACAAYYQYRRHTDLVMPDALLPVAAARQRPHPARPRSGGKLSADLLRDVFLPVFRSPMLNRLDDQAVVEIGGARLAFTTDSFVVKPLFFRGGDIGSLAVHGTVNDLAMCGAEPLYLSAAFILEEGFAMAELRRISDPWRGPPKPPASRSSPAIPRWSRRAAATASSSTPPASASCRRA